MPVTCAAATSWPCWQAPAGAPPTCCASPRLPDGRAPLTDLPAPAPLTRAVVDGLAVLRRRPEGHAPVTVVLVHGAMDRAASFGRTMRRLGDLDVVAYDRRGYAGSLDAGVAPDLAAHAEDLTTVARWCGGDPVVVVGHSVGGLIALLAAEGSLGALPLRALGCFETPMAWLEPDDRSSGADTIRVAREHGPGAAAEFFYRAMVGDVAWQRMTEADRGLRIAEGPALVAEVRDARRRESAPHLGVLGVGVHVGMGGQSAAHLRRAAQQLSELTRGPLEEIADAGHGAHLSHPDQFARWVRAVALGPATPGASGAATPGASGAATPGACGAGHPGNGAR